MNTLLDQLPTQVKEKPLLLPLSIELGSSVISNPDHPQYTADKAAAKELAGEKADWLQPLMESEAEAKTPGKQLKLY